MPSIKVKENEPFDIAIRRFRRACEKAGILTEIRKREFYEKPTSVRKRKAAAAVKRVSKRPNRTANGRRIKLESVGEFNDTGSWKDWRSIKHKWPNFDYYNADVTLFKVRNAETNAIHLYKPKANKEYSKDYL